MKKLVSLFLVLNCLTLCAFAYEQEGLSNFKKTHTYTSGQFFDVSYGEWFDTNVASAFEYGLMNGTSKSTFSPNANITIAETIVLASRIHSIYHSGKAEFLNGNPWYEEYINYAVQHDIISNNTYSNYNEQATRAEFAVILAASLPDSVFKPINNILIGSLPDVPDTEYFATAVYKLYNAGILTGNNEYGTFAPHSNIQRNAVSAIITRIIDTNLRKQFVIKNYNYTNQAMNEKPSLTSEQVSQKVSPAVFYIESYGFNGEFKGTGSGFFISKDGIAVTNFHVVANSIYNKIITSSGDSYDNVTIIDYDKKNDIALLRVQGTDFSCIEMGDSSIVSQGQQVYAIGSPLGLTNTMSQGIISNQSRYLGDVEYIQISVPINHGSSGGALIDVYGKVIGITSAGFETTGDLNLAIPINNVKYMDQNSTNNYYIWDEESYPGYTRALDFGKFSGVQLLSSEQVNSSTYTFEYDIRDFHSIGTIDAGYCYGTTVVLYEDALIKAGFECTQIDETSSVYKSSDEILFFEKDLYESSKIIITVSISPKFYDESLDLPDFGWYSELSMDSEPYYGDESLMYSYRWIDYYYRENFINVFYEYFDLIEEYGWEYLGEKNYTEPYPYVAYVFRKDEILVAFDFTEKEFIVDIFYS